jgi:prokaryotic ubiquitin-like protein Pup
MERAGQIGRRPSDARPAAGVAGAVPARRELLDGVDELLDEIDGVLEENAEEFIRGYVQKGGQ